MALRGSTRTIIRSHFVSMAARNNFFHFSSFLFYLPAPIQGFHCHSSAPVLKTCSVKISLRTSPKTTHAYLMCVLWFSLPCFNSRISVCVSLSHTTAGIIMQCWTELTFGAPNSDQGVFKQSRNMLFTYYPMLTSQTLHGSLTNKAPKIFSKFMFCIFLSHEQCV